MYVIPRPPFKVELDSHGLKFFTAMHAHFSKFRRFMFFVAAFQCFALLTNVIFFALNAYGGNWFGLFNVAVGFMCWQFFGSAMRDYGRACVALDRINFYLDKQ